MDAGVADTINRHAAQAIAIDLDAIAVVMHDLMPGLWHDAPWAAALLEGGNCGAQRDLMEQLAAGVHGVDGAADSDWDNLISHFRAEILARRDPQTPPAPAAETQLGCVV